MIRVVVRNSNQAFPLSPHSNPKSGKFQSTKEFDRVEQHFDIDEVEG